MRIRPFSLAMVAMVLVAGCQRPSKDEPMTKDLGIQPAEEPEVVVTEFGEDVSFLTQHTDAIVLGATGGPQVVVVPELQGRVMTSTVGLEGMSLGWINYPLVEQGVRPVDQREGIESHFYAFGGEERFWIGPEGGQFTYYFAPGDDFTFDQWLVPAFIDTEPWSVVAESDSSVTTRWEGSQKNWSGLDFSMAIDRQVELVEGRSVGLLSGFDLSGVSAVAYTTTNTMTNTGDAAWTDQTGMPSIWILGMYKHGPRTTVAIPVQEGDVAEKGVFVKDDYFGKVPAERLVVKENVVYLSADGEYRSKIGISPKRSLGVAGSWDAKRGVLTLVTYNVDPTATKYVNSAWEMQTDPFSGDVINSYNDGPVDGDQMGPFYELETSSPALGLAPGQSYSHVQTTIHLKGDRETLDAIARAVLRTDLASIESAL